MSSTADSQYESRLLRPHPGGGLKDWVSISGIASLSFAGLFYLWSLRAGSKAWELESAQDISRLEDLLGLVQTLPALVAIRGRVNSHLPKKCELCDKQAVIHEVVEEEVWRKQRSEGRTVYEPFETRKVFEECEWFLEDGSGVRVKVENALQADRLRSAMEYKSEFVGEDLSKTTLGKVLMEKAWQMTKHGMRKTERYLPVGAVVTCVGELSQNHIRTTTTAPTTTSPTTTQAGAATSTATPASATSTSTSSSHTNTGVTAATQQPRKNSWLWGAGDVSLGSDPQPSTSTSQGLQKTVDGLGVSKATGGFSQGQGQAQGQGQSKHWGLGGVMGAGSGLGSNSSNSDLRVNEDMPLVLRKPSNGPSYITPLTLGQLKAAISGTARNCRYLAYVFGAVGAALIVRKVLTKLWQRARERRIRQRVAAAEAARKARQRAAAAAAGQQGTSDTQAHPDTDDYVSDRSPNTCVVCLEERVEMVFTACGHMCVCVGCGLGLDKCPICRIRSRAIKVYSP